MPPPNKTDSADKKKNYSTGFVCIRPALLAANLKTIPTLKKKKEPTFLMCDDMQYSHHASCTIVGRFHPYIGHIGP